MLRTQRMPYNAQLAEQAGNALADGEFSSAVHEIAFRRIQLSTRSTTMRFRYSAVALAMQDERLIVSVLSSRGLELRPGLTPRDLATMLTALNEGLALRVASRAPAKSRLVSGLS